MNKKYWKEFNKKKLTLIPTAFAVSCIENEWITENDTVIDLGCGNGRDTYYLNSFANTEGLDYYPPSGEMFHQNELKDFIKQPCKYSVVYSRFFLNSITTDEIEELLNWTTGKFIAEFRVKGDKPMLYPDHERNFVDSQFLLSCMLQGYKIIHFVQGRGLAPFKGEDPLVCRIIAEKKSAQSPAVW